MRVAYCQDFESRNMGGQLANKAVYLRLSSYVPTSSALGTQYAALPILFNPSVLDVLWRRSRCAGAGPSRLTEQFEGNRDLRSFAGFLPTASLESRRVVAGKFCLGTLFIGGPPPPLKEKEVIKGEAAGIVVLTLDITVVDQGFLLAMEESLWTLSQVGLVVGRGKKVSFW